MSERQPFSSPSTQDFSTYGNELLKLLYNAEQEQESLYNPYNDQALNQLEEVFSPDDGLGEAGEGLGRHGELFFALLNEQWPKPSTSTMGHQLIQRFGATIPHEWLQSIARQAQQFVTSELSGVEALVNCVQPLLSQWSREDLQIFARPIAVAMRGQNPELLDNIPTWEQLSPVQQARYTLAIADYALQELKKD